MTEGAWPTLALICGFFIVRGFVLVRLENFPLDTTLSASYWLGLGVLCAVLMWHRENPALWVTCYCCLVYPLIRWMALTLDHGPKLGWPDYGHVVFSQLVFLLLPCALYGCFSWWWNDIKAALAFFLLTLSLMLIASFTSSLFCSLLRRSFGDPNAGPDVRCTP
jgi:hypothetical protein